MKKHSCQEEDPCARIADGESQECRDRSRDDEGDPYAVEGTEHNHHPTQCDMPEYGLMRSPRSAVIVAVIVLAAGPAMASDHDPSAVLADGEIPVAVIRSTTSGYWVTSPCGSWAHIGSGTPVDGVSVVIDPGHGGPTDTGAVAPTGMPEKELNLIVAREVVTRLTERGIAAVLTRAGDYSSPLFVRANLADRLGATIMVSIHHNSPSPGRSSEPGVEIFIQHDSTESQRLGGLLWENTMSALSEFDVAWVGAGDAGVMTVLNSRGTDAYGMIRHPETPTALIELGYVSNPAEAALHQTPEYVEVAGESVARAIAAYLRTDKPGSGYVRGRVFNPQPGISRSACVEPTAFQPTPPGRWKPDPAASQPE